MAASQSGNTGIVGAAVVFAVTAWGLVGVGAMPTARDWLGPIGPDLFVLTGLELAAAGFTIAVVSLALGPRWRGRGEPRTAWVTASSCAVLILAGAFWIIPRWIAPALA